MDKKELSEKKVDSVIELFSNDKISEALDSIEILIKDHPNESLLFNIRGACYATLNQPEEAIKNYKDALAIKPDYSDASYNLGNALKSLGHLEEAVKSYKKTIAIEPNYHAAQHNLGVTLQELGLFNDAAEQYEEALNIKPDNIEAQINLGFVYQSLGQLEEAVEQYESILSTNPENVEVLNNLGIIYRELGDADEAISYYKKVLEIDPGFTGAYYNLGFIYQDLGQVKNSIEQYEKAISISDHAWSYHNLSYLKQYSAGDPQIAKMQSLLSNNKLNNLDRIHLCLALAKIHEKLGNQIEFFQFLNEGNSLRKKELGYSLEKSKKIHSAIIKIFTSNIPSIIKPISKYKSKKSPIFIVGMPRSGTSLVEQILDSHNKVYGAGELNTLTKLINPVIKNYLAGDIKNLTEKTLLFIYEEYLDMLSHLNTSKKVITDKLPLNFQYIGFILSIFPDAKIIHLKRDARATCWSNYKHFFTDEENGYSHNFEDLVGFYSLYDKLMDFWHDLYPNKIYDLCYEDLTNDQENETRKLIEYCDLDWDNNCLNFDQNERQVKTPSTLQVRQKIYKGSSEAWKKHWAYIQPLINGLKSY
ncbi:tetratricopeptide repeat protein [Candidatus Thioglobus sp.]|nr:tetratricopeptide repeat protein [Candidatus Thioglobus sp.]